MKRTFTAALVVLAIVAGAVGAASTASASPTKKSSCSNCHKPTTAVKISLARVSETTTTVTYSITITGGKGTAGWAVFKGGTTNVKRKTASTGTFATTKGKTYKVWAVKRSSGSRYKTIRP